MHSEFESVIGLETHCQLSTDSKIFCGCRARLPGGQSVADVDANSNTCPICAGHPGTLPVLNRRVVEYAIQAGLATNCSINRHNVFARKNYFYPDLPKGYQISQYELPICANGWLEIETPLGTKRVSIQRIHMEEDAGKNVHAPGYSVVNLNRAGVPLIEIVTGPDMRSAEEAGAYMRALYAIVTFLGICDGNLEEGNFRCDVNVSVMPRGSARLGTRAEIKNVNSFRFIEKAIGYEIARQVEIVRSGGTVVQETRLFDAARGVTISMRSKEEAMDYRYFPDPDLVPVQVDAAWIEGIRAALPELPHQKRARYVRELCLAPADAGVITASKELAEFFEKVIEDLARGGMDPKSAGKPAANWVSGEVLRLVNDEGVGLSKARLVPRHVADVVRLTQSKMISSTGAKQALGSAWKTGDALQAVVDREGLRQVSDAGALDPVVEKVIAAFPGQVAEYRAGKEKLLGFFVGQVMKEMGGKANPSLLQELIKSKLGGSR